MALTTEVNLKLLLSAQNDASDVLTSIMAQANDAADAMKLLADVDVGPLGDALMGLDDIVTTLGDDLKTTVDAMQAMADKTGTSKLLQSVNRQLATMVDRIGTAKDDLMTLLDQGGASKAAEDMNQQLTTATDRVDTLKSNLASLLDEPGTSAAITDVNAQLTTADERLATVQDALTAIGDTGGTSKAVQDLNAQLTTADERLQTVRTTLIEVLNQVGTSKALEELNTQATTADDRLATVRASLVDVLQQAGTSKALENMNAQLTTLQARLDTAQTAIEDVLGVGGDSTALVDVQAQLKDLNAQLTTAQDRLTTLMNTGGDSLALTDMTDQLTTLQAETTAMSADLTKSLQAAVGVGVGKSGVGQAGLAETSASEAILNSVMTGDVADLTALDAAMTQLGTSAQTVADAFGTAGDAMATAGDAAKTGTEGLAGGSSESILSKTMMIGMNAMMAMYGMQALGNAAGQFSTIQQMQMAMNSKPNQAAQMMMMLGTGGITGSSAAQFLTGLKSNMISALTTPNGQMSKEGIMLESLGMGKAQATESPQYLLQAIQQDYMKFVHQGLGGSSGAQLLQLTGTSQLAGVFAQWGSLQKQASSVNLGMTSKQVDKAASQGLSLEMSLQQLSLAFDELAVKLIPAINPLIHGLAHLTAAFAKAITSVEKTFHTLSIGVKTGKGTTLSTNQGLEALAELKSFWTSLGTRKTPSLKELSGLAGLVVGASDPLLSLFDDMMKPLTSKKTGLGQSLSTAFGKLGTDALKAISASLKTTPVKTPKWLTDLGTNIGNDLKTAGASLMGKKTGIQAAVDGWASTAMTDLKSAFKGIHAETSGPLTTWATKAWGDLKTAFKGIHAETQKPLTAWASKAIADLTAGLVKTYADLTGPLDQWASNLTSSLGTALHNAYTAVASTISVVGRSIGLQLQAMIEGMIAYMENAAGNLAGKIPIVGGGLAKSLHGAAGTSAHESSDAQLQAAVLMGLMNHGLSAQMANRVGVRNLQASHGVVQNNNFTITGLVGNDRAMAKKVIDQIVTQLKLQGNFSF